MIKNSLTFALLLTTLVLTGTPARAAARPVAGFQHAYAYPTSAPWDGAALSIIIQSAPVPSVVGGQLPGASYPNYTVNMWTMAPPLMHWFALPGVGNEPLGGSVIECKDKTHTALHNGRLLIRTLGAHRVEGELRVALSDHSGRELVFPFSAPILSEPQTIR